MDADLAARRPHPQDSFHDVRRQERKELHNAPCQGPNDIRAQKESRTQSVRPGRVLDQNPNKGGYPRSSLPGVIQEFRVVKDNRIKKKADVETVLKPPHKIDSGNGQAISNINEKSSTEKLTEQSCLDAQISDGHGPTQAGNEHGTIPPACAEVIKPSRDQTLERSEGTRTIVAGAHAVLEKGSQGRVLPMTSGSNNVCCSSSDPIHVPSLDSRPAGIVGAIRREVGAVGSGKQSSYHSTTNTSTSDILVSSATKADSSYEHQSGSIAVTSKNSRFDLPTSLSNRRLSSSQYHSRSHLHLIGHQKVTPNLEWKPKSALNPSSVNHAVNVAPSSALSSVDGNKLQVVGLSEKLSELNVFKDVHVIIPEHLRVPESERGHLVFGSFESEVDSSKAFTPAPDTVVTKEELTDQPFTSALASNCVSSTDNIPADDQTYRLNSFARPQQPDSVVSAAEHEQSLTEDKDILNPVINENEMTEMTLNKVPYSSRQLQRQENTTLQNFKGYNSDSSYDISYITAAGDGETAKTMAFPSEILDPHPANTSPSVSAATQPMSQMYHQQVQQYPNLWPYRQVFHPFYPPPMAVPNYSSNPAYPLLPHASSLLVMPNGTSQLTVNGMKYAPSHHYKQVFPGSHAGYSSCNTATLDDVRSKYKDNNLYMPNPQADTADIWIQTPRDVPNMPSPPFYNLTGQAAVPHTAYLPVHNGNAPFSPAPQPPLVQYPGLPHMPQPASMAMLQSSHGTMHQPVLPPLGGNVGVEVAAMAPGAQVGAFQQNQLGQLGWTPNF